MTAVRKPGVYVLANDTVSVCEVLLHARIHELWRNRSAWTGLERPQWRAYMRKYIAALRQMEGYRIGKIRESVRRAAWRGLPKSVRRRLRQHHAARRLEVAA